MKQLNIAEVEHRFTYHAPSEGDIEMVRELRTQAKLLAVKIAVMCPPERSETRNAIECVEQAIMWANASMIRGSAARRTLQRMGKE
jgi:hypothetical protein